VTGDLVERLRSALDEAERIASAVILNDHEPWWTGDDLGAHVDEHDSAFIVANGPAVVLRTIQAHRKIVDAHPPQEDQGWDPGPDLCYTCRYDNGLDRYAYPCPTVLSIAAIYLPDIQP
jgi:hypothetical protein